MHDKCTMISDAHIQDWITVVIMYYTKNLSCKCDVHIHKLSADKV